MLFLGEKKPTPPKINIEPENDGLEDDFPLPAVYSQVPAVNLLLCNLAEINTRICVVRNRPFCWENERIFGSHLEIKTSCKQPQVL